MFTTYRVPPLRRSGLGEGVRPINAWFATLKRSVASVLTNPACRSRGKCASKLINAT